MNLPDNAPVQKGSLVLYKSRPALVVETGAKITLELPEGKNTSVRPKDFFLLHPGPLAKLSQLQPLQGEIEEACEMLYDETTTIQDLAELIYSEFTPQSAWAVCELLLEGAYFYGTPGSITVRSRQAYEDVVKSRQAKAEEKAAWQSFLDRVRQGAVTQVDKPMFTNLELYALGQETSCRLLKELSIAQTPANAHGLLLKLKVWDYTTNPYIKRQALSSEVTFPPLGDLPQEQRRDLTHLRAFAIDDEGSTDPDDAISIEGGKLWVHIADAAALVTPGCPADEHARSQSANLYLPEVTIPMLPPLATQKLGMGLQSVSPALSFGIELGEDGSISNVEICLSQVKVERLTYSSAQDMLGEGPLRDIHEFTKKYRAYRQSRDAIFLSFPEVKIKVVDGKVIIKPIPDIDTQDIVTNAMVMAGEGAARFAIDNQIPFPFASQVAPEVVEHPTDMAAMFTYRRQLRTGEVKSTPQPHAGLGLSAYSRVTSPLRRYLDLLAHQQLRAFLNKTPLLEEQEMINRIGAAEAMTGTVRKLEYLSNQHWTLVYLLQNPQWQGEGIVLENRERFSIVIIPQLGMETRISGSKEFALNEALTLKVDRVDLPGLSAFFSVI